MFSFSESSEGDMEIVTSAEAPSKPPYELSAAKPDNSGSSSRISQGFSILKTEPCADSQSAGTLLPPHHEDNKEKISIFRKPSVFSFPAEIAPFQIKRTSSGPLVPPSTTAINVSSNKSLTLPEVPTTTSQLPFQNISVIPPDSSVSSFTRSTMFSWPKESAGSLFQPPKATLPKVEKSSFSFAETFKKKVVDRNALAESQQEQHGAAIFGRTPTFSFSSAAASILPDNKVFDRNSNFASQSPPKNLALVSSVHDCEQRINKDEISKHETAYQELPTISSGSCQAPKDDANLSERRMKHKREFSSSRIRKKTKDDEGKVDSKSSKLISPEEIHQITSVVCKGIHPDLNHRNVLFKHFSKFGEIKRISCSTRQDHAVVTFFTHEAAEMAKKFGGVISPGFKPAEIFWAQKTSKLSGERKSTSESEVNQELQSMMEIVEHDILDRPLVPQSSKSAKKKSPSSRKRTDVSKPGLKDSKHSEKIVKRSKPGKVSESTEDSLKKLLEMAALTEGDKFRVLDARDKLIRLSLQKQSDISKAKAIVGTCPDICSEKERYSRFTKKCLSVYEQKKTFDPKVSVKCLDHRIIVKEYSRSSADKEEPLPHEIRPTHVLTLTMDHLMCNIANRITDSAISVGEWYDFIWNRTRAIRKDITQQDLCNIDCVKLVEKCVRFHIHCAAALCDEDMAIFDRKINDENLTKSLQTLKHMYHDLAVSGIRCSNEAEFRAYDILLSLNEGDTLRQAQNFSSEIRDSPEVRFAVSAAFAMNSNNYIRFFKLVEEASYLNACIMHSYFTPVRVRALRVMLKAYCLPNHTEMYPLKELVSILKFESTAEASQFCQWLGFQTDENYVQLDRMSFANSSSSVFVTRSINLVERKRNVSVGEVMNKGPLPVNPLISYETHNSFDCDGYLKKEAYDASDQKQNAQQCNKIVTTIQLEPVFTKQLSVVPVTKPVMKKCEIPVSASSKQASSSNYTVAVNTSQLHKSSTSISIKQKMSKVSAHENLSIPTPLSTADETIDNNHGKEEVVQSSTSTVPKQICSLTDLGITEVMKYATNIWEHLSSEVLENCIREVVTNEIMISERGVISNELMDCVVNDVVKDLCFDVSCDVIREVALEEINASEIQEQQKNCVSSLTEEMILEMVQEHVSDFVEHEYVEAKKKALDATCCLVMASIFESCISDLVISTAKEIYDEEMENWKDLVQTAKRKTQLQQARKALVRWQRVYIKRRKLEICRDTFPCSPQVPLKMKSVVTDFGNVLSRVEKAKELSKLLDAGVLLSGIKQELSWLPLDLSTLFEKHFPKSEDIFSRSPKTICWKLLLLMPESNRDQEDADWISFIHWLCAKFCREKCENAFQDGMILCDLFSKNCLGYHVDICVRAVLLGSKDFMQNLKVMKEKRLLEGTSGIFLVMPFHEMDGLVHEKILNQLQQILSVKHPVAPVPLYCFVVGSEVPSKVPEFLSTLKRSSFLCDYEISIIQDTTEYWKSSEMLLEAVVWLLKHYNENPLLMSCNLKNFVEDCFLKIFSIIHEDLSHVKSPTKAENPSKIINFYNSALDDYVEVVCSSSLSEISWPPPEIITCDCISDIDAKWNELENLNKIRSTIGNIYLPEFKGTSENLEDMWRYTEVVANLGSCNISNFFSSIKSFLMKNEQSVANRSLIPWTDVLYDCAHYLISCQPFMDESVKKKLKVVYIPEHLNCLDLKLKWKCISLENEMILNGGSAVLTKKRKHSSDESCESSETEDLSDVFEHSPIKYARNDNEEEKKGITCVQGRTQHEQTAQQQYVNFSVNNFAESVAEENPLHFIEALDAEKCQSESYLSLLEAKVAEGREEQWINEEILAGTYQEEDSDTEVTACNPQPYGKNSDCISRGFFSELYVTTVTLQKRIESLEDSLAAQQEANKSFERRLSEFM